MKNHLYFVCPTDNLETVIDRRFGEENYFLTSIGNSIIFTDEVVGNVNALVEAKKITKITFVLSDDNRVVKDALNGRVFSGVSGLDHFYGEINTQGKRVQSLWQSGDLNGVVLSYYLQERANQLRTKLSKWIVDHTQLDTKIYHRHRDGFSEFNGDLFQQELYNLN